MLCSPKKVFKKVEIADEIIAFRKKQQIRYETSGCDMEAQGLPGQELYNLVMSTLAAAKASN